MNGWIAELRQRLGMPAVKKPEPAAATPDNAAGPAPAPAAGRAATGSASGGAEDRRLSMRTHMNRRIAGALVLVPWLLAAGIACAQEPPAAPAAAAHAAPRPDQLEPGVDTSKAVDGTASAPVVAAPAAAAVPPAPAAKPPAPSSASATAKGGAKKGTDRLNLDTTDVRGNHELPKVMYIVPWKRSDLGDLVGRPPNSLLDEVLQPLDRDVFKRENRYYEALQPDQAGQNRTRCRVQTLSPEITAAAASGMRAGSQLFGLMSFSFRSNYACVWPSF